MKVNVLIILIRCEDPMCSHDLFLECLGEITNGRGVYYVCILTSFFD